MDANGAILDDDYVLDPDGDSADYLKAVINREWNDLNAKGV